MPLFSTPFGWGDSDRETDSLASPDCFSFSFARICINLEGPFFFGGSSPFLGTYPSIIFAASAASTPSGTVGGFGACASVARGGRFSKTSILMFWLTLPNDLSTFLVGKLTGSLPTIFRSLSVFVVAFSLPLSAFRKPPFRPDSFARASFASSPPSPVRSNASVVPKSSASTLCAVQQNMSSDAFRYTLRFLVSIRYFPSGLALLPEEVGMDFWARSDVAQSGQPHRPASARSSHTCRKSSPLMSPPTMDFNCGTDSASSSSKASTTLSFARIAMR
mmetsp:Transcript_11/g.67  ORF Transcript_11/g.67 Transcript_11/m.67 type:complete len:276 (+) Transcript_11:1196-2023(+)